jgi:hypothetical protein
MMHLFFASLVTVGGCQRLKKKTKGAVFVQEKVCPFALFVQGFMCYFFETTLHAPINHPAPQPPNLPGKFCCCSPRSKPPILAASLCPAHPFGASQALVTFST